MTYHTAFIMVGRCLFWTILVMVPPMFFALTGYHWKDNDEERSSLALSLGIFVYAIVICCARWVQ